MKSRLIILVFGSMLSTSLPAEVKICTTADAQRAAAHEESLPKQQWTWQRLYKSFRQFGHCADAKNKGVWDAELATAYNGAVQYLLVQQWGTIETLNNLSRDNSAFLDFVIAHINEDFPADDAAMVVQSASLRCPQSARAICSRIAAAANATP